MLPHRGRVLSSKRQNQRRLQQENRIRAPRIVETRETGEISMQGARRTQMVTATVGRRRRTKNIPVRSCQVGRWASGGNWDCSNSQLVTAIRVRYGAYRAADGRTSATVTYVGESYPRDQLTLLIKRNLMLQLISPGSSSCSKCKSPVGCSHRLSLVFM